MGEEFLFWWDREKLHHATRRWWRDLKSELEVNSHGLVSHSMQKFMVCLCQPSVCLLLVVTSHLVLEVFTQQLLLSGIVSPLTSVLAKLSQHSADTWNLIFFIQPLPLPSDPSQHLWFVHDHGTLSIIYLVTLITLSVESWQQKWIELREITEI